jgi:hypothetical protein
MMNDTDGNLAALRRYEREVEYNERAAEEVMDAMEDDLSDFGEKVESLIEELKQTYSNYLEGFDHSELVEEMICEEISNYISCCRRL